MGGVVDFHIKTPQKAKILVLLRGKKLIKFQAVLLVSKQLRFDDKEVGDKSIRCHANSRYQRNPRQALGVFY